MKLFFAGRYGVFILPTPSVRGSPWSAIMVPTIVDEYMSRSYSSSSHVTCITPIHDIVRCASPMSLSGDTWESGVDWICDQGHLAESLKMMLLCRHCREACFSRAHSSQPHSIFLILEGQVLSDATVDSQYAIKRDFRLIASGDKCYPSTPRPKRMVSA